MINVDFNKLKDLGLCPCGKKIYAGDYFVVHEMPYCEKFKILDVVDYLTYVRIIRTGGEN